MAAVNKIDSNVVGLRIAEETSFKVLPGTPDWISYDPNSYGDFGGNITTTPREPITDTRQIKKGPVTDKDITANFSIDLTQTNLQPLMQGAFFADFRRKGEELVTAVDVDITNPDEYEVAQTAGFLVGSLIQGQNFTNAANNAVNVVTVVTTDVSVEVADGVLVAEPSPPATAQIVVVGHQFDVSTVDVDQTSQPFPRLVRASGVVDWTTLGLIPGEPIFIGGDGANEDFVGANNNGFARVRQVGVDFIELDKTAATMTDETGTGLTIRLFFGRVLKNEVGTLIKRRTWQLERTLGAPDDALPSQIQAQYIEGGVIDTAVINIPLSDKITVDMGFLAGNETFVDGPTALKTGNRPTLVDADAFNTSSDFSRIKLGLVSASDANVTPLFAFVTELTVNVSNNLTANKAVGVLGAFDITAGNFQVSASMTAYFALVSAIQSVQANSDVTLDWAVAVANAGIFLDIPLVSLADGLPDIQPNQAITLPLTANAAIATKVVSTYDHTLLMSFFDYLPNAADT
jgi:hypothetical protein